MKIRHKMISKTKQKKTFSMKKRYRMRLDKEFEALSLFAVAHLNWQYMPGDETKKLVIETHNFLDTIAKNQSTLAFRRFVTQLPSIDEILSHETSNSFDCLSRSKKNEEDAELQKIYKEYQINKELNETLTQHKIISLDYTNKLQNTPDKKLASCTPAERREHIRTLWTLATLDDKMKELAKNLDEKLKSLAQEKNIVEKLVDDLDDSDKKLDKNNTCNENHKHIYQPTFIQKAFNKVYDFCTLS